jgi:hypothetical protein
MTDARLPTRSRGVCDRQVQAIAEADASRLRGREASPLGRSYCCLIAQNTQGTEIHVNKLRIIGALALTLVLGYFIAFGSDYGAEGAFARKSTYYATSTKLAGNSTNIKAIVTSSTVLAGNTTHLGQGQVKTTGATTTACKPTGNSQHSCG